jgi:hypothetical protein
MGFGLSRNEKAPAGQDPGGALAVVKEGISMHLNPLVDLATTYSPAS